MGGPALGAAALTVTLQNLSVAGAWRQIIFGTLLAVVVIARPTASRCARRRSAPVGCAARFGRFRPRRPVPPTRPASRPTFIE